MTFNSMEIQPLTPWIGAEIFGVDLTRPLSNDQVEAIHEAFLKYLVIFFRDQRSWILRFAAKLYPVISANCIFRRRWLPFRVPDHSRTAKLHDR